MDIDERDVLHGKRGVERSAADQRQPERHAHCSGPADLLDCVQRIGRQRERVEHDNGDDAGRVGDEQLFAECRDDLDERGRSVWRRRLLVIPEGDQHSIGIRIWTDEGDTALHLLEWSG